MLSDFLVGKTADVSYGPGTLREATPGVLDEYMDSLTAHPPELFIDTSTAGIRGYGHYPVRLVPQVGVVPACGLPACGDGGSRPC